MMKKKENNLLNKNNIKKKIEAIRQSANKRVNKKKTSNFEKNVFTNKKVTESNEINSYKKEYINRNKSMDYKTKQKIINENKAKNNEKLTKNLAVKKTSDLNNNNNYNYKKLQDNKKKYGNQIAPESQKGNNKIKIQRLNPIDMKNKEEKKIQIKKEKKY